MFEKVVGRQQYRAFGRDVLGSDRPGPVQADRDRGQCRPDRLVDPVRLVVSRPFVDVVEIPGGPVVFCTSEASVRT